MKERVGISAHKQDCNSTLATGQCTNQITRILSARYIAHKKIVIRARIQHMCDDLEGDLLL